MNTYQNSQIKMISTVLALCRKRQSDWAGFPAFVACFAELEALVEIIQQNLGKQMSSFNRGIRENKDNRQESLKALLLLLIRSSGRDPGSESSI